jgi:hypothetical protein
VHHENKMRRREVTQWKKGRRGFEHLRQRIFEQLPPTTK